MLSDCAGEYHVYFPLMRDSYGPIDTLEEAIDEAGAYGMVIGPLTAKSDHHPVNQDSALTGHYLKILERPIKRLSAWELAFVSQASDEYRGTGRLPAKTYGLLERLAIEKADVQG